MKIKTIIFFILLIALVGGMVWVNGEADKINNDIGIAADTIYGDQTAASGLDIGLSFETNGSLLWKSNVAFSGKGIDVNSEFTKGSFDTRDKLEMERSGATEGTDLTTESKDGSLSSTTDYLKDLETGDITMIADDKGFQVYENKDGNLSEVMERSFDVEDGPETLGRWYEDNKYRCRKVYYDGERLAVSFRIARPDPFYKDHRGTAVLVYSRDDLEYIGVIGSELYGIRDVAAPDYYATAYEFGRFIGQDIDELVTEYTDGSSLYEPNEEYKAVQKRNQEADKEEGLDSHTDQVFDMMGLGYYDIEYIKRGD